MIAHRDCGKFTERFLEIAVKRSFQKAESLRSEATKRTAVREEILGYLESPDPAMANGGGWNSGSGG